MSRAARPDADLERPSSCERPPQNGPYVGRCKVRDLPPQIDGEMLTHHPKSVAMTERARAQARAARARSRGENLKSCTHCGMRGHNRRTCPKLSAGPAAARSTAPAPIRFTLPTLPQKLNQRERQRWIHNSRAIREEKERLAKWILATAPVRRPIEWPAIATLTFYTPHGRGDADGMAKTLLDAMQGRVIHTDSPKWIRETRLRTRKGTPRTEIELAPAPPELA